MAGRGRGLRFHLTVYTGIGKPRQFRGVQRRHLSLLKLHFIIQKGPSAGGVSLVVYTQTSRRVGQIRTAVWVWMQIRPSPLGGV